MEKVIVTLTTIPTRLQDSREDGIKSCINSLISQDYTNGYEIHFNIPEVNKFTNTSYFIPGWLKGPKYDIVKIYRVDDMGPPTKLVPTVKRITDPETIIIVVDDDFVYNKSLVSQHVQNQIIWEDSAVGYDGLDSIKDDGSPGDYFPDSRNYYFSSNNLTSRVNVLQHYKSVSYKRRYFEEDFFQFVEDHFVLSDDLLISAYLAFKKIDRISTDHPSNPIVNTFEEWISMQPPVFPIICHTNHSHQEGWSVLKERYNNIDSDHPMHYLYTRYINAGYNHLKREK